MLKINHIALKRILDKYEVDFPEIRDSVVEDARLPPAIFIFEDLCKKSCGAPPTQEMFVEEYILKNSSSNPKLFEEHRPGVVARIKRTYPSLVRDYHLYRMLSDYFAGFAENIIRTPELDYYGGVDVVVVRTGKRYNIHTQVESSAAEIYGEKKKKRHRYMGHHILLPKKKEEAKRKIWLYTGDDVEKIRQTILGIEQGLGQNKTPLIWFYVG